MSVAGGEARGLLAPVARRRRVTDQVMRGVLLLLTLVALVPLVLVVYYLIYKGAGRWSGSFFTTDPNGNFFGDPGGIRSAILGTIEIVALASVVAVPIGIAVALYLTEYGRDGRLANIVRYFVDVMTGVPSVVFGLFISIVLVVTHFGGSGFAAWKGSVALALLMLPIVVRSSEVVLLLVPAALREAALALGAPRWRIISRIVLPSARSGLVTGSLLSIARAAGETAPLIFTVSLANGLTFGLNQQMNSLPLQIYTDISNPRNAIIARAWGAALTLVALVLILNLVARAISARSRVA